MDLLDWTVPHGVQGKSLTPLLRGGEYHAREAIYGEIGLEGRPYDPTACTVYPEGPLTPDFTPRSKKAGCGQIKSVRTRHWKLVHYPGQLYGELYDLDTDPWELHNLYGKTEYRRIVSELRARLLDWTIESKDCLPAPPAGVDIVDG